MFSSLNRLKLIPTVPTEQYRVVLYLIQYNNVIIELNRRHILSTKEVWSIPASAPQTLLECFELGCRLAGEDGTFCGTPIGDGKYLLKSYSQMNQESISISNCLNYYGIKPKDMIAIYSANRYEYDAVIIGAYRQNVTNVALYDTLGSNAVNFILEETEITVVFVDTIERLKLILKVDYDKIKRIILIGQFEPDESLLTRVFNLNSLSWAATRPYRY